MTERPDQPLDAITTTTTTGPTTNGTTPAAAVPQSRAEPGLEPGLELVSEAASAAADRAGVVMERAGDAMTAAAAASGRVATSVVERLRNDAEFLAERGSTRIEDEVVEKVAGIAAREVPGVHDLGGDTARFFASVKERVGLGESERGNRGISVRLEGRTARIVVTLVVEYGIQVYPVTEQVRANVIEAVESMLDLQITEVNIVVDDVAAPTGSR